MIMSKKYRVGRKQRRVVLDENGIVVVEFPCGMEKDAQEYCEWRNRISSPLKPLSELHKDEEACRRVAALLFGEPLSRNIGVNRWDGGTTFWYMGHSIDIEDDGEFGYEVTDSSSGKTVNIFALVDLIRELGYGSEKKEI